MILFYAEFWNIHQLCILQVLKEKETILAIKAENWPRAEFSVVTKFRMLRQNPNRTSNEDCRDIVLDRLTNFYLDNGFLCHDKAGEVHEEECCDIPCSVATLIQQMVVEFCHNKRQLYRDRIWKNNEIS